MIKPFLVVLLSCWGLFMHVSWLLIDNAPQERQTCSQARFEVASGATNNGITSSSQRSTIVQIPFFGSIDVKEYSLPFLAVTLGLVDGFNPCAMWVLVYLISLLVSINDRKKIWFLVGAFVAASGVLYFLFMSAWLNAFLVIGYQRMLTMAIGLFAFCLGGYNVWQFLLSKGKAECKVTDIESKKKTMNKIKNIVFAPLTALSILGIIGLAVAVNSIEFICSAGLPAIYTYILSLSGLNPFQYYAYILAYVFFFMLDDLLIFGSAALAINSSFSEKYVRYTKPIGGAIMIAMGIVLTFFPNMLR